MNNAIPLPLTEQAEPNLAELRTDKDKAPLSALTCAQSNTDIPRPMTNDTFPPPSMDTPLPNRIMALTERLLPHCIESQLNDTAAPAQPRTAPPRH